MSRSPPKLHRRLSDAARAAAIDLRRANAESFGVPEMFVVKANDQAFTWELRRFGGVLLQRGAEAFPRKADAEAAGAATLAEMLRSPDLPVFERQNPLKPPDTD